MRGIRVGEKEKKRDETEREMREEEREGIMI